MRQPLSLPKKNPALQKLVLCVLDRDQHDHYNSYFEVIDVVRVSFQRVE